MSCSKTSRVAGSMLGFGYWLCVFHLLFLGLDGLRICLCDLLSRRTWHITKNQLIIMSIWWCSCYGSGSGNHATTGNYDKRQWGIMRNGLLPTKQGYYSISVKLLGARKGFRNGPGCMYSMVVWPITKYHRYKNPGHAMGRECNESIY